MDKLELGIRLDKTENRVDNKLVVIDLRETEFESRLVKVGSIFQGIALPIDVNALTENIVLSGSTFKENLVSEGYVYCPRVFDVYSRLKEFAENVKFYGNLREFKVTILPPSDTQRSVRFFSNYTEKVNATEGLSFETEAGMYSSGRGRIGSLTVLTRTFLGSYEKQRLQSRRMIWHGTSIINLQQSRDEVSRLLEESRRNARGVSATNLLRQFRTRPF